MRQQVLHTARLTLVPLADEHLEYEVEMDSDPEVMRYLAPRTRTREEVARAHERRMERGRVGEGLGLWVGFLGAGSPRRLDGHLGDFAGLWMLTTPLRTRRPGAPGEAELGFQLPRNLWRHGLASEGARELLRHGFEDLGLNRIYAQTLAVHLASRATMASTGLAFVRAFHEDHDEPVAESDHDQPVAESEHDEPVAESEHDEPIAGAEQGEVEYAVIREEWLGRGPSQA